MFPIVHPVRAIKTVSSFLFPKYPYTNGMNKEALIKKLQDDSQWGSWSPNKSKGQNEAVLVSVLEALERFPESKEIQHHGLKSVLTFSSHPEYAHTLGRKLGLLARSQDPSEYLTVTKILLDLTTNESTVRFVSETDMSNVVSEAISIVDKSTENKEVQVNGVTLLNRLARARPKCREAIISSKPSGIKLLASAIGVLSDNPANFSTYTELLEALLLDEGMCSAFYTNGGYKAMLDILKAKADEEYILSGVLDVLLKTLSLGYYKQSITPFTEHAINVAVSDSKTEHLVEKAVNYLLHVSLCSVFFETKDLPNNEISAIITSTGRYKDNENILIYGALALNNIIRKAPDRIGEIIDKGADSTLFSGMERHIKSEKVQYICAMVLSNFAAHACTGLTTPERMGIIRTCLKSYSKNSKVQMAVFGLLGRIAVNGGEEAKMSIAKEVDCIGLVSELLSRQDRDQDLIVSGLVLLKRIFSSKKAASMVEKGKSSPIKILCEKLNDYNLDSKVKVHLCRALSMLAQTSIFCCTMHASLITRKACNLLNRFTEPELVCASCNLLCVLYGRSATDMLETKAQLITYALYMMDSGRNEEIASKCYELISVLIEVGKESVSDIFLKKYGLTRLIDDMVKFKDSKSVQRFCCKILLYVFMFNKESASLQGNLQTALKTVISTLNNDKNASDSWIQTYGLNILVLASEMQPINVNAEGATKTMTIHKKDPLIQELGCDLLERIKGFCPQAISSIMTALYAHPNSESVQKYGLLALNTALRSGIELPTTDHEQIQCIISAMEQFPNSYQIQILGLLILYRFISSEPKLIRYDGLIDTVLKALKGYSSGEAIYAKIHVIEKMGVLDRESTKIILDKNGIYNTVNLISINRFKMKFLVLGLYSLASFALDKSVCDYLFEEKETLSILSFLKEKEECQDADLFVWGFLAIGRLAYHSAQFRSFFIKNGFHLFIARVMLKPFEKNKKEVYQTGCFALANIAYDYPIKSADGVVVSAITAAVKSYSCPVIQICGCSALHNLCENICFHKAAIDTNDFLDAVFKCINSRSIEVQLLTVKTLGLLWTISDLRVPIAKRGGIRAVLNVARDNYGNAIVRSASARLLALMTYRCGTSSDRQAGSRKMQTILNYIESRQLRGDEAKEDKEDVFSKEDFVRSLLESGSLAIEVLGKGAVANSDEVKDYLAILWNIAPYYYSKDNLCKNEIQVLMTQALRGEEYLRYVFCTLGALANRNSDIYLPLTCIISEASRRSVESKLYALRILESAQCIPKGLENMDVCVNHLSEIFRAHTALRLPVMRVFENFVFMFSDEACEPVAGELVRMLRDTSNFCGATKAFIECFFRTLMWALSEDEIQEKVFSEDAKAAVSKLHDQYGGVSVTVDKCFKAIMRVNPPEEVEISLKKEFCTCNAIKLCSRCPAKTSGRFCPNCCCQQVIYICEGCRHTSGMKKKFCASCWGKTHHIGSAKEVHTYTKRYVAATCDNMKLCISSSSLDDF